MPPPPPPSKRRRTVQDGRNTIARQTPSATSPHLARVKAKGPSPPASSDEDQEQAETQTSIFERTSLTLASNPLPPIHTLASTLSKFSNLHKLDLSYMQPGTSGEDEEDTDEAENKRGVETLRFLEMAQILAERDRKRQKGKGKASEGKTLAETLTWLNLAGNPSLGHDSVSSSKPAFQGLESVKSLFVLNLSSCSLRTMPPKSTLMNLTQLRALILTQNRLDSKALEAIPYLPNLNTLVLSHNEIGTLPASLPANLPQLAKLSISHNRLGDEGDEEEEEEEGSGILPDFTMCSALREVRLSHNPKLTALPQHIKKWGRGASGEGRGLDLLDVGHCNLTWDVVSSTLLSSAVDVADGKRLRALKSLTLAGNVDVEDEEDYRQKVKNALPGLTVLDNQRLVEKAKKGVRGGTTPAAVEDGAAQWPQRGHPGPQDQENPLEGGKKRKRDARGSSNSADDARLLARAGPSPSSHDDESDAGVASDEETGKREIIDQPKQGKRKRAKRGKKKDMWTGGSLSMDSEEAGTKKDKKKTSKPVTGLKSMERRSEDASAERVQTKGKVQVTTSREGKTKKEDGKKRKSETKVGEGNFTKAGDKGNIIAGDTKRNKKEKKDKQPRVAWDALPAKPAEPERPAEAVTLSGQAQDKDKEEEKKSSRAQTSVAGIVEVKRSSNKSAKREVAEKKATPFEPPTTGNTLFGGDDSAWADGSGSAWDRSRFSV